MTLRSVLAEWERSTQSTHSVYRHMSNAADRGDKAANAIRYAKQVKADRKAFIQGGAAA